MELVRVSETLVRHVGRTAQPCAQKAKSFKGENDSCVITNVTWYIRARFSQIPRTTLGSGQGRAVKFLG
jgi:hypothetical protein